MLADISTILLARPGVRELAYSGMMGRNGKGGNFSRVF
jgi:hypothetical protein